MTRDDAFFRGEIEATITFLGRGVVVRGKENSKQRDYVVRRRRCWGNKDTQRHEVECM